MNAASIIKSTLPVKKEEPITHVALLVDNSGSMGGIMAKAREMALAQYNAITTEAAKTNQRISFDLWSIDSTPKHLAHSEPGTQGSVAVHSAINRMVAGGATPLFLTARMAAETIEARGVKENRGDAVMLIIVTDGQATDGGGDDHRRAKFYFTKPDVWSTAVVGPASVIAGLAGTIPRDNLLVWDGTGEDLDRATNVMTNASVGYLSSRTRGATFSTNYFTANLPSENVVKATLANCYPVQVKSVKVEAEEPIADKVVRWTRKPYALGEAFYQLTKPERIQPEKEVLIREKGQKIYYGGPNARALLGLAKEPAKVTPGNFGNYDIFVQSTSVNRKLVRGTDLLVKV